MTVFELDLLRRAIRPLDCGALYCRYCPAGSNNRWLHDRHCAYVQSMRDYHDGCVIIDREKANLGRSQAEVTS